MKKLNQMSRAAKIALITVASFLILFLLWILYPKDGNIFEALEEKDRAQEEKEISEKYQHPKEIISSWEDRKKRVGGRKAAVPSGILITGTMTLYDLEGITGIPARTIAGKLGIPSQAPLNEHLGGLAKRYSFTMQRVRDVVARLLKKNQNETQEQS